MVRGGDISGETIEIAKLSVQVSSECFCVQLFASRAQNELFGVETASVAMNMLTKPLVQYTEIAHSKLFIKVSNLH